MFLDKIFLNFAIFAAIPLAPFIWLFQLLMK